MRLRFRMPARRVRTLNTAAIRPRRWYGRRHLHATSVLHTDVDNFWSLVPCSMARTFVVLAGSGMAWREGPDVNIEQYNP
jgi:hypothetical protein